MSLGGFVLFALGFVLVLRGYRRASFLVILAAIVLSAVAFKFHVTDALGLDF